MSIIYGVDTAKSVSAHDVRDAIVLCFANAHSEALEDLRSYAESVSREQFERMKIINVQQLIRGYFSDVGGDFENPTKESIIAVLGKLKEFAKNFRNQSIIDSHYKEIEILIQALS